jgi:hypothetical protein
LDSSGHLIVGVIPSGAVLQAKRGISRAPPLIVNTKLHHDAFVILCPLWSAILALALAVLPVVQNPIPA